MKQMKETILYLPPMKGMEETNLHLYETDEGNNDKISPACSDNAR